MLWGLQKHGGEAAQSGVEESGKAFWKKQNNSTLFL